MTIDHAGSQRRKSVRLVALMAMLLLLATIGSPSSPAQEQPSKSAATTGDELRTTFTIPLKEGRADLGQMLARIADEIGIDGQIVQQNVVWTVDVTGTIGKLKLESIEALSGGVVAIERTNGQIKVTIDRVKLRREEGQLRLWVQTMLQQWVPEEVALAATRWGMRVYQPDGSTLEPAKAQLREHVVVLIHGVDEPGGLWVDFIPALQKAGHQVVEFRYPNDQPVTESGLLLADELAKLKAGGVKRVSLVSHSMGGLVSRSMLADDKAYRHRGEGDERLPAVKRLFMIGTPNQGSPMAQFLFVSEARDQLARTLSGEGLLFGCLLDGLGEAKEDLLPGSSLLNRLNSSPLPRGVKLTIIAGDHSPIVRPRIDDARRLIRPMLPVDQQAQVDRLADELGRVADQVGDGCVSVASTKIAGVDDHHVVEANHATLIRRWPGMKGEPPAIAIVIERLKDDAEEKDGK